MSDNIIPKYVFYGEFSSGGRKRGGQKLRFKDALKRYIKNVGGRSNGQKEVVINGPLKHCRCRTESFQEISSSSQQEAHTNN